MKKVGLLVSGILLAALVNTSVATPPLNISCAKQAVINYYKSGEYEKDVEQAMAAANDYLTQRIHKNDAQRPQEKLAIILDIDETSLSNFEGNKKFGFSGKTRDINRTYYDADAPAIKPVLATYNTAIKNKVDVFFITYRPDEFRTYTITNLQKAGFYGWKELYMPSKTDKKLGSATYKTAIRKKITEEGYTIILNVGDQESDLVGGYAEYLTKLPNPLYTSNCGSSKNIC